GADLNGAAAAGAATTTAGATINPALEPPTDASNLGSQIRWVVCGLLFFATLINYIDRQILALLKGTLDKDLGWTNAEYGLANSMFQIAYGLSFIGFGWFIDRFGTKIGYAVSIALW